MRPAPEDGPVAEVRPGTMLVVRPGAGAFVLVRVMRLGVPSPLPLPGAPLMT